MSSTVPDSKLEPQVPVQVLSPDESDYRTSLYRDPHVRFGRRPIVAARVL